MNNENKEKIPAEFKGLLFFSVLIEALITYINELLVFGEFPWKMIISMVLGITTALGYNLDLPERFGLSSKIKFLGCVMTGILLSRGSNYIADLLGQLTA